MAECGSCKADIVWADTPRGSKQPFDREPNPEGNRVLLGRGPNLPPLALPVDLIDAGPSMLGPAVDECRYMPHHATCPSVEEHR
jgi:hypothetical protein